MVFIGIPVSGTPADVKVVWSTGMGFPEQAPPPLIRRFPVRSTGSTGGSLTVPASVIMDKYKIRYTKEYDRLLEFCSKYVLAPSNLLECNFVEEMRAFNVYCMGGGKWLSYFVPWNKVGDDIDIDLLFQREETVQLIREAKWKQEDAAAVMLAAYCPSAEPIHDISFVNNHNGWLAHFNCGDFKERFLVPFSENWGRPLAGPEVIGYNALENACRLRFNTMKARVIGSGPFEGNVLSYDCAIMEDPLTIVIPPNIPV